MKYILTTLFAGLFAVAALAQCNAQLEKYITGFDSLKASSFSFFDSSLKDVRIVGYGEDTHGTAEFTLLTKDLMTYLSQNHGFKILILETGFGEGQYLNDYIQGRRDDLKTILKEHNSTWRYNTQEFHQLMNGLREYNQNHAEKIHVYGSEMQYVISDANRIRDFLKKADTNYRIDGFEKHLWQPMEEYEKTDYYVSYVKLKNYFTDNYEILKSKTSEKELELAYRHVLVLGQFVMAIHQNAEQRKHDMRDMYIAENIEWILHFHGTESKALYWAHNAHVGDWVDNGSVDVAGHQLRKMYGDAYFNLATDFGTGEYMAFSHDGKLIAFGHESVVEDSFTACLKDFGKPNAFLNIRQAREDSTLIEFLNSNLTTMSGAGAVIRDEETETKELGKAFDGIIYLNQTHKINWAE
ncbi:erythromycin esterase family protein [bacterium SCSIO 12741]|nr:erythromycin esterase family protein [bacterium SCSIO 12741]